MSVLRFLVGWAIRKKPHNSQNWYCVPPSASPVASKAALTLSSSRVFRSVTCTVTILLPTTESSTVPPPPPTSTQTLRCCSVPHSSLSPPTLPIMYVHSSASRWRSTTKWTNPNIMYTSPRSPRNLWRAVVSNSSDHMHTISFLSGTAPTLRSRGG